MRRGWSIEKQRVEAEINAMVVIVRVDGASPPALSIRSRVLGSWPITVGRRAVTFRRVRSIDVARTELWVDGERVPPSQEPIVSGPAKDGARCKIHPSGIPPEATIACGVCHAPVCGACLAVDSVRCRECFARASEEMHRQDRANRIKGPVLTGALIVALAVAGFATHSAPFLECAAGLTALLAFLLIRGLIRERIEERKLPPPTSR